ncbi:MAG: hypothetical protein ACFWT2_12290 [Thermoanaerobacterium thermosaccharolyticum]
MIKISRIGNIFKNRTKQFFKNVTKKLGKKLLVYFSPYLIPIGIVFLLAFVVYAGYMAIYIQLTGGQGSSGATITYLSNTPQDKQYRDWVESAIGPKYKYADDSNTDDFNVSDMWVKGDGTDSQSSGGLSPEEAKAKLKEAEERSQSEGYSHIDPKTFLGHSKEFLDVYNRDEEIALTFGQVYTFVVYENGSLGREITQELVKKVAKDIHPTFKYTKRLKIVVVSSKDSSTTYYYWQYKLDEADTILGHFKYHYSIVSNTTTSGSGDHAITITTTEWQPTDTEIVGDRWNRINKYLKTEFKVTDNSLPIDRQGILEGFQGFDENQQRIEWLARNGFDDEPFDFVSCMSIPPQYREIIEEASKKYHIPTWFIAAVIMRESSFNWLSVSSADARGLMQITPATFASHVGKVNNAFGTSYTLNDIYDPRANILVGTEIWAEYLSQQFGSVDNVDWKGDGWIQQTLEAGFKYNAGPYAKYNQSIALDYMESIWEYAKKFKATSYAAGSLPVKGTITSMFGWRSDPFGGGQEYHSGIDIACNIGTPVHSVSDGKVLYAGSCSGYGNIVVVRDSMYNYLYAHLSKINVKTGDMVKIGDIVALSGNEGRSTGPHLHFGISKITGDNWNTSWIDPLSVLNK